MRAPRPFKANYEGTDHRGPARRGRVALLPACARVIPTLLTAPSSTGASRPARVALGAFAEIENVQDGHKVPSDRKCSTAQYYYCGTYVACTAI